ncbi:MAG: hypothetical protein WAM82_25935 [Thermoanaerobaculia bacterium]
MSDPNVPPPPSYTPPPPPPGATPPGGVSQNRGIMLVLAYLGLLAIIPLVVEKNDPEVQWHAKHGLVLTVLDFVVCIVVFIILAIVGHIPVLGCFTWLLWPLLLLGILVLHVICIVKATKGERFIIPGVSEYANRF